MDPTDPVTTYAQQAIDRWTLAGLLTPKNGRPFTHGHHPASCGCLSCSDGRDALGIRQPIPSWARRAVPDIYRKRWKR